MKFIQLLAVLALVATSSVTNASQSQVSSEDQVSNSKLRGAAQLGQLNFIETYNDYEPLEATSLPCTVASRTATIGTNYKCGSKATDEALLYYPTGGDVNGNYPVVFFHPGSSGFRGDNEAGYVEWARKIAGQCVVVVIPKTYTTFPTSGSGFQDEDLCKKDYDLKLAYDWARESLKSEIGGRSVNFDRIGVMGHSAGGHHIPKALSNNYIPNDKVKAIVFSHSGKDLPTAGYWPGDHGIPTMMVTSAKDCTVRNKDVLEWYKSNKAKGIAKSNAYHTVFASTGGSHMEPVKTGYFSTWMGRFLACHLFPSGDDGRKEKTCKHFYGTSADICSADHLSVTPSTRTCKNGPDLELISESDMCDHHGSTLA